MNTQPLLYLTILSSFPILLLYLAFMLSPGLIESIDQNDGLYNASILFAVGLSLFAYFLCIIIPLAGMLAIYDMPKEIKRQTLCVYVYKCTIGCLVANFALPSLGIFLLFFSPTSSHNMSVMFMIISIGVAMSANLMQMCLNMFLFYNYRHRHILFALLTQLMMCMTIFFIVSILGSLSHLFP